jgi:hypothetical protein
MIALENGYIHLRIDRSRKQRPRPLERLGSLLLTFFYWSNERSVSYQYAESMGLDKIHSPRNQTSNG